MNAVLKPITVRPLRKPDYRGWWLVRSNQKAEWVRLNADLLAEWFAACEAALDSADLGAETLDSFAEAQWDVERMHCEQLRDDGRYDDITRVED